jgi:hypothetical protein
VRWRRLSLRQRCADLLGSGDDDGVDLGTGLDACFHGAPASNPQDPDHFHLRIPRLWRPPGPARLNGPGRGLGIQRIGLAATVAGSAIRTVDLDHGQAIVGQKAQQPGRGRRFRPGFGFDALAQVIG